MIDIETLYQEAKEFFETAQAARQAAAPLKEGATVALKIKGHAEEFHVVKSGDILVLKQGRVQEPDWTATVMPRTIMALRDMRDFDIGDLGVALFERMAAGVLEPDSDDSIQVELNRSFLAIARRGYFGIIPLGGPKVARYLAAHELMSLSGIREVFRALRKK